MSSDDWCSPPEVTEPLAEFFGGAVDCDPCSNSRSIVKARVAYTFGGLHRPWGWTSYENCPYSQNDAWTSKAITEMECGNVDELVRLNMASTSSHWWARACRKPRRNPWIIFTKRIEFLDPDAAEHGVKRQSARFEPALMYYGPRVTLFERYFRHLERWTAWGR